MASEEKKLTASHYPKLVQWSEADGCFVGICPGLVLGGCHGDDEKAVFEELCQIVEEVVAIFQEDGRRLPEPVSIFSLEDALASNPDNTEQASKRAAY